MPSATSAHAPVGHRQRSRRRFDLGLVNLLQKKVLAELDGTLLLAVLAKRATCHRQNIGD